MTKPKHPKIKTLVDGSLFTKQDVRQNLTNHLFSLFDGDIVFPEVLSESPYVLANFVKTVDGIISFSDVKGRDGGGEISGFNTEDVFIMGLLRTLADAVLVGANTLRIEPKHKWTPEFIFPEAKVAFQEQKQREKINKKGEYINTFVTLSGSVPFEAPVFSDPNIKTIVFTTKDGAENIKNSGQKPDNVIIEIVFKDNFEKEALRILRQKYSVKILLVEGGPKVFGSFLSHNLINEIWLTESPILAGNSREANRPTLVMGEVFHPDKAPKLKIISEKYNFDEKENSTGDYRYFRYKVVYPE